MMLNFLLFFLSVSLCFSTETVLTLSGTILAIMSEILDRNLSVSLFTECEFVDVGDLDQVGVYIS